LGRHSKYVAVWRSNGTCRCSEKRGGSNSALLQHAAPAWLHDGTNASPRFKIRGPAVSPGGEETSRKQMLYLHENSGGLISPFFFVHGQLFHRARAGDFSFDLQQLLSKLTESGGDRLHSRCALQSAGVAKVSVCRSFLSLAGQAIVGAVPDGWDDGSGRWLPMCRWGSS